MNNITYRQLRKCDYNDIMGLIDDAWNIDRYINKPKSKKHLLNAFMRATMLAQNYTEVAVLDGEVVGLLFGKIPKLKGFWKNIRHIVPAVYHSLCLNFRKYDRNVLKGFVDMQNVYAKLLENIGEVYESELEFFIVNSKCQGLGVGKTLLNNYLDYCRDKGIKNQYVYTDVNCNYGFYDHNGYTRSGTMKTAFDLYSGKFEFDVFIYTRKLYNELENSKI